MLDSLLKQGQVDGNYDRVAAEISASIENPEALDRLAGIVGKSGDVVVVVSAFPGSALGLSAAVFIYALGTLAGALSFLPGGLVATEATLAVLLAAQGFPGVDPATADALAVASTLLIRLATLWFAVAVGGVGLLWLGARRKASRS